MISLILVLAFGALTYVVPRMTLRSMGAHGERFAALMLLGFGARILGHFAIRNVSFFSGGGSSSGDARLYELAAWTIARLWGYGGIEWFTAEELPVDGAGQALLAVHAFAVFAYANGGEVPTLGCVAMNAFLAAITCLHLVRLGTMIKGTEHDSRVVALAMYFSPAFIFHTAEMFKDGLSAFLVVSAVLVSFRLSERFNPLDLVLGMICLFLLWFVRFYLVFLVTAPLVMSLLGVRSGHNVRIVLASAFILASGLLLIATQVADTAIDIGYSTFEHATSFNVTSYNASTGGSGVMFDNANPWLSFPQKLAYTLLSPFPWDFRSSSIGFQVGKLDVLLWGFFMFRGVRGARRMWQDDRGTLLMFLVVLVPLTIAYAATMANIGLIVRQRIPIVMLGSVLAVRGLPVPRLQRAARDVGAPAPA